MSTLKLTTLSNQGGTASVPSETVINGTAKAWVNFNGTGTVAIRASFNVSSITDNSTGNYTVNFTGGAIPDSSYCAVGGCQHHAGITPNGTIAWEAPHTTTQLGVYITSTSGSYDPTYADIAIFR
jgi:hypothetical protein